MKNIFEKKKRALTTAKVLSILIGVVVLYFITREFITNTGAIIKIAHNAGALGPIALIIIIALGTLFTPIPSFILIMTAGYIYGAGHGAIYSYVGQLLASMGTFGASKIMRVKAKNKTYEKYKDLVKNNKNVIYALYAIPIVPVSITSILSASSGMKFKEYMKIPIISFILPVIFFSFFGQNIGTKNLFWLGFFIVLTIAGLGVGFKLLKKKNLKKIIPKKK